MSQLCIDEPRDEVQDLRRRAHELPKGKLLALACAGFITILTEAYCRPPPANRARLTRFWRCSRTTRNDIRHRINDCGNTFNIFDSDVEQENGSFVGCIGVSCIQYGDGDIMLLCNYARCTAACWHICWVALGSPRWIREPNGS